MYVCVSVSVCVCVCVCERVCMYVCVSVNVGVCGCVSVSCALLVQLGHCLFKMLVHSNLVCSKK